MIGVRWRIGRDFIVYHDSGIRNPRRFSNFLLRLFLPPGREAGEKAGFLAAPSRRAVWRDGVRILGCSLERDGAGVSLSKADQNTGLPREAFVRIAISFVNEQKQPGIVMKEEMASFLN